MSKQDISVIRGGAIARVRTTKPNAPRSKLRWLIHQVTSARAARSKFWVCRFGGVWEVHDVDQPNTDPVKTFPNREAAEMWMLHRDARS